MKAIIAEIDKKQMVVITDKGDFIKVKRQMSVGIGDEIELKPQKINVAYRRLATMAACFLMCIFLSTGVYAYYTPYSYVSVDINPSIALSLNRFERVIAVNPLNEDGVSLLEDKKSLKNKDIDDALSAIIKSASEKGYLDAESENQVMVVVSTKNQKQEKKLAEAVTMAAEKELSKVNEASDVMVEKATVEKYKEALSNKMSPGKEILAGKLREVMPEIKDEDVNNMSVKEVVHLINEGRKAIKSAEKDKDKDNSIDKKEDSNHNPKPTAAASKDIKGNNGNKDKVKPAVIKKDSENKDEKSEKPAAAEVDKDDADKDANKDSNKDSEGEKKKENDENAVNSNNGSGNIGNNNDGDGTDKAVDEDKDSKDKEKESADKDKDKKDGR